MARNARYVPIVVSASPSRPRDAEALLERLRHTAVSELVRHLPEGALCGCCGEVWPCDRARLADLALS
jgi:hypothetical protein